jgi:hypothetical protein
VWVSSYRSLGSVKPDSQREGWLAPFSTDSVAAMDDLTRRNFGPNADPVQVDEIAAKARVVQPGGATGSGQGIACSGDPRTRSQDDRQDR